MPLDDARRAVPTVEHMFPKAEVCCGVSIREGIDTIQATVIAGKLDSGAAGAKDGKGNRQVDTPFFKVGDPTIYDGEVLDVPTFFRKNITLPGTLPKPVAAQTTLFDKPIPSRN